MLAQRGTGSHESLVLGQRVTGTDLLEQCLYLRLGTERVNNFETLW